MIKSAIFSNLNKFILNILNNDHIMFESYARNTDKPCLRYRIDRWFRNRRDILIFKIQTNGVEDEDEVRSRNYKEFRLNNWYKFLFFSTISLIKEYEKQF